MSQLSGHDATFLYSDTAHSNSNVSLIHIYDPSTAPGGTLRFKTLLAHIESRLDRSSVFRRKLQLVPLGLDHPYWIADENFDLEYHVRHIALPKPGDWRQFCIQVSRIHARPLDLARPLWEIYVIEGLDSFLDLPVGSFALLTKTHHAAIDIDSGSEITMLLHDSTPAPPAAAPPAPWFPASPPSRGAMLCRSMVNSINRPFGLTRALTRLAPKAFAMAGDILLRPERLAQTRFNSAVSAHRVFETRRFALAEFKAIRGLARGATVNDAVLAVCGGALRRYLQSHDELPEASLSAIAPFIVRDAAAEHGERPGMGWLQVRLGTHIADPVQRLAYVRDQTAASETVAHAVSARELTDIGRHAPAATLALTSKLLGRAALGIARRAPLANCTLTNVPGPAVAQYLCGARMTYFSAVMPIADGMGLAFAVTSYDGRVVISPTSCRELMPDPEHFAQCLRDSFQECLAAVALPRRAPRRRKPPAPVTTAPRRAAPRASAGGRRPPTGLRG